MRVSLASVLAVLALVAAGCGGSVTSSPAAQASQAAKLVPGDATAFISLDTDLDSPQWTKLKALADRFPGKQKLVDMVLKEVGEENLDFARDIEPAFGPQVAIVFPRASSDPVVLTQPDDRGKLETLLKRDSDPSATTDLDDGWVAIAETQAALDAFENAAGRGNLAENAFFTEALTGLPDDALATVYVRGEGLFDALRKSSGGQLPSLPGFTAFRSVGAAVEATDDGLHLVGAVRSDQKLGEAYTPTLLEHVPDRVVAAISFHGSETVMSQLRSNEQVRALMPLIERVLGVSFDDLAALLKNEGTLYVRPGLPIPEVTLAVKVDDESAALATADRLMQALARLGKGTVATTGDTHTLTIEGVRISWAAADGTLVLTSGATGIADFRASGDKLADDEAFTRASEKAGLGDKTSGLLYLDLQQVVPLLDGLASLAGEKIPAEARENLDPLDSLLVQATTDGDTTRFQGFLGVRDR